MPRRDSEGDRWSEVRGGAGSSSESGSEKTRSDELIEWKRREVVESEEERVGRMIGKQRGRKANMKRERGGSEEEEEER